MPLQFLDIQSIRVIHRAIVLDDADDFEADGRHQARRHAADISKSLDDDAAILRRKAQPFQRLHVAATHYLKCLSVFLDRFMQKLTHEDARFPQQRRD